MCIFIKTVKKVVLILQYSQVNTQVRICFLLRIFMLEINLIKTSCFFSLRASLCLLPKKVTIKVVCAFFALYIDHFMKHVLLIAVYLLKLSQC